MTNHMTSRWVDVVSTLDGAIQPVRMLPARSDRARPLLVVLHTWQGDVHQAQDAFLHEAQSRDWHFVMPNFRGANGSPESCGSELAVGDVMDAIDAAMRLLRVDASRIYLAGGSGGGHMTLLVAGRHPSRFAAASAWCSIVDLAAWHRETSADPRHQHYARSIETACGGEPGRSAGVDQQYAARSPLTRLKQALGLPIEIAAGIHDGVLGSVPFLHSVRAFNLLAEAQHFPEVTESEVNQLLARAAAVRAESHAGEKGEGAAATRQVHLRRQAGLCELKIFEGGHECLTAPACRWLERYHRDGSDVIETLSAQPNTLAS